MCELLRYLEKVTINSVICDWWDVNMSLEGCTHQILAVVLPESGNSTGAGFPQQAEAEAAVNMHPDLLLR